MNISLVVVFVCVLFHLMIITLDETANVTLSSIKITVMGTDILKLQTLLTGFHITTLVALRV